jgi:hypothetical protein
VDGFPFPEFGCGIRTIPPGYLLGMARAVWTGAVSFGSVNVPVRACAAGHDHSVHFNRLEEGTGARVDYRKVSDKTAKDLGPHDIGPGYEVSPGHDVTVDEDALDVLRPRTTRTIDTTDFADLGDVDLAATMEAEGTVGIGTSLAAVRKHPAANKTATAKKGAGRRSA